MQDTKCITDSRAASEARANLGGRWIAGKVRFYFVEADRSYFQHLERHLTPFIKSKHLECILVRDEFANAIPTILNDACLAFSANCPVFAFIDPFGATGVPFRAISQVLVSRKAETLINFDADGFARILKSGMKSNASAILDTAFGNEVWRSIESMSHDFRSRIVEFVRLYKMQLLSIPGVQYAYGFEMLTSKKRIGSVGYFLVHASQHPTGLRKMKAAWKQSDHTGLLQFSNALAAQPLLFPFSNLETYAIELFEAFKGRKGVSFEEVDHFALNETPYENPKKMLSLLEKQGRIHVRASAPKRRRGNFKEGTIDGLDFSEENGRGEENGD